MIAGTVASYHIVREQSERVSVFYNGPAMVSTGVDSRDGNTVGDDRKSSKTSKRKQRVRTSSLRAATR
jgi:hypothetical protein